MLGYDTSPVLDKTETGKPDMGNTTANEMAANAAAAAQAGLIVEVTPEMAQTLANLGVGVLATMANPEGHGHVGIVAPSSDPSNMSDPMIGQAGRHNEFRPASKSFLSNCEVHYHILPLV